MVVLAATVLRVTPQNVVAAVAAVADRIQELVGPVAMVRSQVVVVEEGAAARQLAGLAAMVRAARSG